MVSEQIHAAYEVLSTLPIDHVANVEGSVTWVCLSSYHLIYVNTRATVELAVAVNQGIDSAPECSHRYATTLMASVTFVGKTSMTSALSSTLCHSGRLSCEVRAWRIQYREEYFYYNVACWTPRLTMQITSSGLCSWAASMTTLVWWSSSNMEKTGLQSPALLMTSLAQCFNSLHGTCA